VELSLQFSSATAWVSVGMLEIDTLSIAAMDLHNNNRRLLDD